MNTFLSVCVLLCACAAYASALPAELARPVAPEPAPAEERESLQPEETAWGGGGFRRGGFGYGYGRGFGGYGGGYGYGGYGGGFGGFYGGGFRGGYGGYGFYG